eukprot:TRINITY_DN14152_c0_g1_i1.p1 TRINITY_DN14152_c0_g1~~TRINITY_DN14152_c0_g1_i1.p1  ORF type:complete len:480 (+),score=97.43 TRINITY_DN14152_c0_g1_i1:3-1442(+)
MNHREEKKRFQSTLGNGGDFDRQEEDDDDNEDDNKSMLHEGDPKSISRGAVTQQKAAMNELINIHEQLASMPEPLAPEMQHLPITFVEAKSLVYRCMTTLGKNQNWFPSQVDFQVGLALEELERRLDRVISIYKSGAIVRINGVSCKDVFYRLNHSLFPSLQEEMDKLKLEHERNRHYPDRTHSSYYVPGDAGYDAAAAHMSDHHLRENRQKAAFFNATHKALRVKSGREALSLLLKSFRIAKELGVMTERHDDEFTRIYGLMPPDATEREDWDSKHCTHIQIRKWVEGDIPEREFRCFVFQNKIAAVTQLYFPAYFPFIETFHRQIKDAISRFHKKIESYLDSARYYSIDIALVPRDSIAEETKLPYRRDVDEDEATQLTIQLIDFSHYSTGMSSCLFSSEEVEALKQKVHEPNFEYEFRWTTKEIANATPKEKYISPYWLEHMQVGYKPLEPSCSYEYISQGLLEMANDFGVKCCIM